MLDNVIQINRSISIVTKVAEVFKYSDYHNIVKEAMAISQVSVKKNSTVSPCE